MPSSAALRTQIESALAHRIPSALTPAPRILRPVIPTGIAGVDELLAGGLPVGAITEIAGPECSGRSALALSFLARITSQGKVSAWIDVSDAFHAESAAAAGVDLTRLLWVRCGAANGKARPSPQKVSRPLSRIDQALRVTDLLLQAGGFSAIVLDMGSIVPEDASRVPPATWFRYRAAAEKTQAAILLLTQCPCAKSSAGLVLRMQPGDPLRDEPTIFTGIEHRVQIARERFTPASSNVIPLRKPPQSERHASWRSRTAWTGRR
jgi:recombination protein RecA